MCRNVGMRIYHTGYRQKGKRHAVNTGLKNGKIKVCGTTVHTTAFRTSRQVHYQVCLQLC